jgi:hypothetical protein
MKPGLSLSCALADNMSPMFLGGAKSQATAADSTSGLPRKKTATH